jgi:hypothetical protein
MTSSNREAFGAFENFMNGSPGGDDYEPEHASRTDIDDDFPHVPSWPNILVDWQFRGHSGGSAPLSTNFVLFRLSLV